MASCLASLEPDTSVAILMLINHPADLARQCCVSRSWHHFGKCLAIFQASTPSDVHCGIMQIELMGWVVYYICIAYVQAIGLPLSQVDILENSGT